jgi:hypothetical protein
LDAASRRQSWIFSVKRQEEIKDNAKIIAPRLGFKIHFDRSCIGRNIIRERTINTG